MTVGSVLTTVGDVTLSTTAVTTRTNATAVSDSCFFLLPVAKVYLDSLMSVLVLTSIALSPSVLPILLSVFVSAMQNDIYKTTHVRVRTHPGKPGIYWNLITRIPGLEYTGILSKVLENTGI